MKTNTTTHPERVRFWVFSGSNCVRITLRQGECLTHRHREWTTEEGYESEVESWELDGSHVVREWFSYGVDCDGRFERGGSDAAHVDDLRDAVPVTYVRQYTRHDPVTGQQMGYEGSSWGLVPLADADDVEGEADDGRTRVEVERHPVTREPIALPKWGRVDSSRRDYSAEAAGY